MKGINSTYAISIFCVIVVCAFLWGRPLLFPHVHPEHVAPEVNSTDESLKGEVGKETLPPTLEPLKILAYQWPPFNFKQKNNEYSGADTEIVRKVLGRMGYQVEFIDMPFKRILNELKQGNYPAMLPCVIGGGREEYLLFSIPVSSIYSVLWKKAEDKFTWDSYDQLRGRKIGASYYHYGAGFLEAGENGMFELDMVAADSPELIHFNKLIDGKIDMFICELSVGLYIRHKHKPKFDSVDYCEKGVGPTRFFSFPISKKYFAKNGYDQAAFITLFNRELEQFAKEGSREKIFDYYQMSVALDENGMVVLERQGSKP